MQSLKNRLRIPPQSLVADLLLSLLATAGLYYVNIMPALVEGLKTGLNFTDAQAGMAGSANVYGAAVGAFCITLVLTRIRWRPTAFVLLLLLIGIDLSSMVVTSPHTMIGIRAMHGIAGGMLVGIAFSVIARTGRPERVFGMLLILQNGLGGLGVMLLTQWVPHFGTPILFMALIAISATTLLLLPLLDDYPRRETVDTGGASSKSTQWLPLILSMFGVFLFQFANMLLFAYIIGLAKHYSLNTDHAADIVGISAWIGSLGSLLVIIIATRPGRINILVTGLLLTALGMWMFHASGTMLWYAIANIATAITWAFVIPYLLGMCANFDATGRAAALGGFASKMGLATGPLIGGMMASDDHYALMINLATVAVIGCLLITLYPARLLDRAVKI